jgi:prophage regulatory protein
MTNQVRFLLRPEVQARTGLSASTLYYMIGRGAFPRPVRLTPRRVAWVEDDILAWQEQRITAGRKAVV